MIKNIFILIACFCIYTKSSAQIENLIVEKYYISDSLDASDTIGGYLEPGSVTYRIYIDLKQGSVLKKIYGDARHALKFESTENIFNNKADGQTFGKDFSRNRLGENTVALDSWLTLGQTTRIAAKTYFGVSKPNDRDGSMIGGVHNDGGSAEVPGGLISNANPDAGIPVTVADGMDTMNSVPGSWADVGFLDAVSGVDSSVFGSVKMGRSFISNNASLQNSGVTGVNPDSNQILIAQITTKGELSFSVNVEIEEQAVPFPVLVKYVAELAPGEVNSDTLKLSPYLKYPAACGCTDPAFLEFNQAYSCSNSDSCKTLIVYGCMDTSACNYDPAVNFHIQDLCCYPGKCNDRDLGVVCPALSTERILISKTMVFPNPVLNLLNLKWNEQEEMNEQIEILNVLGEIVYEKNVLCSKGSQELKLDVSMLEAGFYFLRMISSEKSETIQFIKK